MMTGPHASPNTRIYKHTGLERIMEEILPSNVASGKGQDPMGFSYMVTFRSRRNMHSLCVERIFLSRIGSQQTGKGSWSEQRVCGHDLKLKPRTHSPSGGEVVSGEGEEQRRG